MGWTSKDESILDDISDTLRSISKTLKKIEEKMSNENTN